MTFQTFTGRQYLKIDIANNYGDNHDKLTWEQRLDWFDANETQLGKLVSKAEEPALFYAGVQAWRQVQAGQPIGYTVALDATSSGLQILAALTGDRSAAELCNVVDTGRREDAYTNIYQAMVDDVGEEMKIDRKDTKQAIMTAFYSSKATPKRIFGEGELLSVFYDTLVKLCPGAWECNEAFLSMWQPDAYEHSWVLPDNFHAHIKVMSPVRDVVHFLNAPYEITHQVNAPQKEGRSLGANTIHSIDGLIVREMQRRCGYDPVVIARCWDVLAGETILTTEEDDRMVEILWDHYQRTGYLSARILDHLGTYNFSMVHYNVVSELLLSLPQKPFHLLSNHDCFRCIPTYGNDMRRQYNLQLMLIARSTLLSDLVSQIVGRTVGVKKLDPTLYRDILETNYALS